MSGIAIPGVTSKYQTQETVQKLVKAESTKLDVMKQDLEKLEFQKKAWQELNKKFGDLRTSARTFYSFESAFNDRTGTVSSEGYLTVSASREASEGSTKLEIVQLASADRLLSDEQAKDSKIEAGTYDIEVGDEKISFKFRGGTLREFADSLTRRADGILKASIIETKPETVVLMIEGLEAGADKALKITGDMASLGVKLGLLQTAKSKAFEFETTKEEKTLKPGEKLNLPLTSNQTVTGEARLSFQYLFRDIPTEATTSAQSFGPILPASPSASLRGATVKNADSLFTLPDWEAPKPKDPTVDGKSLFLMNKTTEVSFVTLDKADVWTEATLEIKDIKTLDAFLFKNNNSNRELLIKDVQVADAKASKGLEAKNPVSSAQDAIVKIEGVKIYRPNNTITDLIPGVTLNLENPTEKPITVKIEPDRKSVKDKIIEFVGLYNTVQTEVNILTARKGSNEIISELTYLSDEEKKSANEKLGLYQGDTTLLLVKSRLQSISSSAYETRAGSTLAVLAQMGISTNAAGAGGGLQATNLRGYLQINEKTLDKVLADNFLAIKDMFGRDSNNDLLVDTGIGFQMETYLRPYVQTGGIIIGRTNTLDTQMKSKEKEIKTFEQYLVTYESDLKLKFGRMEGAINQLEASSQEIKKLNSSSN